MHYVYVIECGDGTLYTGYTTDVSRRLEEHRNGTGAKYTRGREPISLRRVERYPTRSAAQSREHEIKGKSRAEKERLLPDSMDQVAIGGST
jgi:putative endonuclease